MSRLAGLTIGIPPVTASDWPVVVVGPRKGTYTYHRPVPREAAAARQGQ